jgi:hypothetical protein
LKSKNEIEIAKKKRDKIKRVGEKTSLFVVKNPRKIAEEIKRRRKEILKFKSKRKKRERKIEIKKKALINLFEIENKIKKRGKRQTKRIAKEFWVEIVLKEVCLEKSKGKMNFPKICEVENMAAKRIEIEKKNKRKKISFLSKRELIKK